MNTDKLGTYKNPYTLAPSDWHENGVPYGAICKCSICGIHGPILYRNNPKGQPGDWRCAKHVDKIPPDDVIGLTEIILEAIFTKDDDKPYDPEEGYCSKRDDKEHCVHWEEGGKCCSCGLGPMIDEEKKELGMEVGEE